MPLHRYFLIVAVISLLSAAADGTTWYVDDDNCPGPGSGTAGDPFCSIQDAIDAAVNGDEVLVSPGSYSENIDFVGKAIAVVSAAGAAQTIIDGGSPGPEDWGCVVAFLQDEGPESRLDGFTLRNGGGFLELGGGIVCDDTSPIIANCIIHDNTSETGGGIRIVHGSPTIYNCVIANNIAYGAVGISCYAGGHTLISNCTIVGNTTAGGGSDLVGGVRANDAEVTIRNSIVWGNIAATGPQLGVRLWGTLRVEYCAVEGGQSDVHVNNGTLYWGPGNTEAHPLFVNSGNGNYRLSAGSPVIDAGHNWAIAGLAATDLDGNPRFAADEVDFDPGCGIPVVVDMGAYEYPGQPFPVKLGDLDADGVVGVIDFLLLLAAWGPCAEDCCLADLDLDSDVGVGDFVTLLANWS